jgi:hypothetical protein
MLNKQYMQLKQTAFMTQLLGHSATVLGYLTPKMGYSGK